ncbi:MAG: response regulator transcription factor [Flavobacteriales bacterium]|jgi:two-component system alkaline phosphatase synthesis response regulator PhoP|nr:response regulator transcription factor [Flavobacteriales bacterium]
MAKKILLVDDETDILDLIKYNLEKEGFDVKIANNGKTAIDIASSFVPDLILLDVMMPEMDGVETCIELRKNSKLKQVIIAFLTARGEDYSQIAGFEAGADDYITKPIKPRVLVSKVKALLRRTEQEHVETLGSSKLSIDEERYVVLCEGSEIVLPKKEFELLKLLLSKPGNVFTRDNIFTAVWGNDAVVGERTIDVHIRKLREKIGDNYISTIKGVGYKLILED